MKTNHSTIPETYQISDGSGRNFYRPELSLVSDVVDNTRRDLYIDGSRKVENKATRSGRKYNYQTEYKLKSIQKPSEIKWIKESELEILKKKGLIE